ncbi:TP901 family phage tail tape measure protein [Agromyces sp. 3263]|uniref:phage tail tape measure protein n=1 Tax=Agromyces sp. 3263 TaxID=2817750 RepID=UPI00285A0343|nr:phage tail tape measure protein [Agromyces sp. 3263]MDR6907465.1 TP901 family phage tail tape measure protein [Agromyces sp. 3263]
MPERITRVTLTAQVGDYVAGMDKAARATKETANAAQKLTQSKKEFDAVGKASLALGALAAAGVGLAVSKFADFDKAMSAVQAATHETTENMALLRDAALEAGASTVFTASESAQALEELAKAGISTADALGGGLKGSLDLAAAGGLEVADAAEIAANALTVFNLAGADVPHVADVLAAGAGKAQGSVDDLSAALKQSGTVAAGMGISLEETVGSLALFASAGITGSDAGTSFRQMLLRLSNPTEESKELMDQLGISVYDAAGQFVGMGSVAGQLKDKLSPLTQETRDAALATIFGADAIRTARELYKGGAEEVAKWTSAVDDSGYAAETAELRLDNLAGDLEKLGGAFDTALIKTGSAANDALRGLTQGVTGVVDAFGKAPEPVQATALAIGAVTAAVGLAGGAFLLAVPKIAAFKAALATMSPAAQRAAGVIGNVAKAAGLIAGLGVAVSILDKLATGGPKAAVGIEKVLQALNGGDLDAAFKNGSKSADEFAESLELVAGSGFDAQMERFGEAIAGPFGITGAVGEARTGFDSLSQALAQMVQDGKGEKAAAIFAEITRKAEEQGISVKELKKLFPEYENALAGVSNEQEDATVSSAAMSEGLGDVESAADTAKDAVDDLAETIRGFGDTQLSVNDANRQVQQSLDDFTASIEENGQTLDITTQEGRDNQAALDGIAEAYKEAAAATVENTGKQEDAIPVIEAGRQAVIDAGIAAGLSQTAAELYADSLGLIPGDVSTQVNLYSQEAMDAALRMAQLIRDIPNSKTVYLYVEEQRKSSGAPAGQVGAAYGNTGGLLVPHLSEGSPAWWRDGVVKGPGGPRDDRVRAMLSPGEFVVNADATKKNLDVLHAINGGASYGPGAAQAPAPAPFPAVGLQLLREIRDRVGFDVPVPAVQGALSSRNVATTTRGRA